MTPVALTWIPGGDAGTYATLRTMRRLARNGAAAPAVLRLAARLRVFSRGDRCQYVAALRRWLARFVRFIPDPPNLELIREPHYMLEQLGARGEAGGDCDDVATLAAALGLAVGLPARFVVYAFESPGAPFAHVFTELYCAGRWLELDTTAPAQFEPWQVPTRRETLTV